MKTKMLYNKSIILLLLLSYPVVISCGKDESHAKSHVDEPRYVERTGDQARVDSDLLGAWSNDCFITFPAYRHPSEIVADTIVFDRHGMMHLFQNGARLSGMQYEVYDDGVLAVHDGDERWSYHHYCIQYDISSDMTYMYVTDNFKFDYTCRYVDTAYFRKLY
ncbi:MAG: hypothetical protein AUK63_2315 [bacterium P3]|nr:MAG: hypothetical protein AUK63_2315 [bacterium P3]KWW29043.1 MAG: hypothetical protein F083_2824 [bacterium F083]